MDNKTINRLYTTAGIVLIIIVVLLIVQAFVFIINPLPDTTEEYLELYNASPLLGVLSLGLMYLMHNVFLLVPYLALFFRLKDTNYALVLLSMLVLLIGLSVYYNAVPCFKFLSISQKYFSTADEYSRQSLLLYADVILHNYRSTGLIVYYITGGLATLFITLCMRKDHCFGKPIITFGFITVAAMLFRAIAGKVEYYIVFLVMALWIVFSILLAINLLKIRNFYHRTTYYSKKSFEV